MTDRSYATAFRDFGIDLDQLDPAEAGRRLDVRSNPLELAFFVDDWALVRLEVSGEECAGRQDALAWRRLIAVACAADPDPWRDALRSHFGTEDRALVNRLARDEKALDEQPPRSLVLLAQVLEAQKDKEQAERLLKRAWRRQPNDFWICAARENQRAGTAPIRLGCRSRCVPRTPGRAWRWRRPWPARISRCPS